MRTSEMLESHPAPGDADRDLLARAIEAVAACAQTCTACADACLAEEGVARLRTCIRTDLDCADVCAATAGVLTRAASGLGPIARAQIEACAQACRACGEECASHAEHHEHCRICAEACRVAGDACEALLAALG